MARHPLDRAPQQAAYRRRPEVKARQKARDATRRHSGPHRERPIIGIDGEGLTEPDGQHHSRCFDPDDHGPKCRKRRGGSCPHGCGRLKPSCKGCKNHKYLYLAAWGVERSYGSLDLDPLYAPPHDAAARTQACFEFLLALPSDALVIGYSLGYDYTKILEGLPDSILYRLTRPETRFGKHGPYALSWGSWADVSLCQAGFYKINFMKSKLSVRKIVTGEHNPKCRPRANKSACPGCLCIRQVSVWDIFAFFQGSFIKACKEWKVVTDSEYDELAAMKARRQFFTRADWPQVVTYCGQECRKMALLGEKLIEAHDDAGLTLKSYYGAGSTAAVMLKKKFDAKRFIGKVPKAMALAIACGFFGGRFEVSNIGLVTDKCFSYDIASAYPYQFTFLPCLACGHWKKVRGKGLQQAIETADAALVRYALPATEKTQRRESDDSSPLPWGPFPFRAKGLNIGVLGGDGPVPALSERPSDGSIIYPVSSGGGWVYRDEFLAGQTYFDNVIAKEAWIYTKGCDHSPFNDATGERETMPQQYTIRLEWGKEGKGIVMKLGVNSCYGKTAQSVGSDPPFQCFVWAGIVTSGCRAQLLHAMFSTGRPESVLMTATDGIVSDRELKLAVPRDTKTAEAARLKDKVGLGAWECKPLDKGIMIIRPGICFPLDLEKELEVKARGIGKSIMASHRENILREWAERPGCTYNLSRTMFFGMKTSIDPPSRAEPYARRRENYGTWADQPQQVSYDPFPKRPRQPIPGPGRSLRTWALGDDCVSAAYERLLKGSDAEGKGVRESEEGRDERMKRDRMLEQPDYEDLELEL